MRISSHFGEELVGLSHFRDVLPTNEEDFGPPELIFGKTILLRYMVGGGGRVWVHIYILAQMCVMSQTCIDEMWRKFVINL